jgi:hypothetical protein
MSDQKEQHYYNLAQARDALSEVYNRLGKWEAGANNEKGREAIAGMRRQVRGVHNVLQDYHHLPAEMERYLLGEITLHEFKNFLYHITNRHAIKQSPDA